MRETEIGLKNLEVKKEKKEKRGMNAQELLDELKKWKENGTKKVQLIFEFGPSEEPVNLECVDLNKAEIKKGEILACKAEITDKITVGVNFDASTVIGVEEWIAGGQANDVRWNEKIEKAERNRIINDEEFLKCKRTATITGNTREGIGANDAGLNKELWKKKRDNAAN